MKGKFLTLLLILAILISIGTVDSCLSVAFAEEEAISVIEDLLNKNNYIDNKIMVILTREATERGIEYATNSFSEIDCKKVSNIFTLNKNRKAAENKDFRQVICVELEKGGKDQILNSIIKLSQRNDIEYVGPNYTIEMCSTNPNDILYSQQWGLEQIRANDAWEITTGSSSVKVGVLDTGIESTHTDLSGNISTTLNADFTGIENQYGVIPIDTQGHGTNVAGIIGAVGNNTIGISGVCWDVELVSLRCIDQNYYLSTEVLSRAISYADMVDIPILNLSGHVNDYDPSLFTVINNYTGLIIAAAGNHGVDIDVNTGIQYPAHYTCNNMIVVGAVDANDEPEEDSNFGVISVDLFAPGGAMKSTTIGNSYELVGGTSMATPYVTGVAALLLSKYPCMTTEELKTAIISSVDNVVALNGLCVTGGRLNANRALLECDMEHQYQYSYTSSSHLQSCICGSSLTEYHSYSYSNVTATTHKQTCAPCGYNTVVPHLWRVISKTTTGHVKQCNCGHTVDEAHTWVQNALGGYMCSVCRQTNNFTPGIQSLLTPAGRLALQAANLQHGQVALIEGLPIIYFNGEYYLLSESTTQVPYPIPPALQTE